MAACSLFRQADTTSASRTTAAEPAATPSVHLDWRCCRPARPPLVAAGAVAERARPSQPAREHVRGATDTTNAARTTRTACGETRNVRAAATVAPRKAAETDPACRRCRPRAPASQRASSYG